MDEPIIVDPSKLILNLDDPFECASNKEPVNPVPDAIANSVPFEEPLKV